MVTVVFQSYGLVLIGSVPPIYWTLFQDFRSAAEHSAPIAVTTSRDRSARRISNRLQYKSAQPAGTMDSRRVAEADSERLEELLSGPRRSTSIPASQRILVVCGGPSI